jgi:hypothetical protein
VLTRVVSSGNGGVEVAALRAAAFVGIETGGYIPRGCRTVHGRRPHLAGLFGLTERFRDWSPAVRATVRRQAGALIVVGFDFEAAGPACALETAVASGVPHCPMRVPEPVPGRGPAATLSHLRREWTVALASGLLNASGPGREQGVVAFYGNRHAGLEAPVALWLVEVFADVRRRSGWPVLDRARGEVRTCPACWGVCYHSVRRRPAPGGAADVVGAADLEGLDEADAVAGSGPVAAAAPTEQAEAFEGLWRQDPCAVCGALGLIEAGLFRAAAESARVPVAGATKGGAACAISGAAGTAARRGTA